MTSLEALEELFNILHEEDAIWVFNEPYEIIKKDLEMLNFIKEKKVDFGWLLHCVQCHPGKIVAIKDHYNLGCNSNNNERMNEDEIKYLLDWLL